MEALNDQGFDYAEGFNVDIENKKSGEPIIHISYKKEKDGKKIFEFNQDVDKEVLLKMTDGNL